MTSTSFVIGIDLGTCNSSVGIYRNNRVESTYRFPSCDTVIETLTKMKQLTGSKNGTKAVISVPSNCDDDQRRETLDAAKLAGLKVLRLIHDPTAAAIAYGTDHSISGHILVLDIGGGSFDVSILCIEDDFYEVKATAGSGRGNCVDFDQRLVDYVEKQLSPLERKSTKKLVTACEKVKRVLSLKTSVILQNGDLKVRIDRTTFEELCEDYFQFFFKTVEKVLMDADVSVMQIEEVLLVGGSTRIPRIQEILHDLFHDILTVHPEGYVVYGATAYAGFLAYKSYLLVSDVTPSPLFLSTPDRNVSIFKRNSTIPCQKTLVFSTSVDNQSKILLSLNTGKWILQGIPPLPARTPQIKVHFNLDVNGVLSITAVYHKRQIKVVKQ
jgi:molecular chaperone DnaK (HSP70)